MRVSAEINLDAVCHNIKLVQNKVGKTVKVLAVIKTNAYGHGAVQIAKALKEKNNIYAFATATVEEAVELRKNGIDNTILILGYSFSECYEDIIDYDISQTVFDYESAKKLSEIAVKKDKTAKLHIKLDTGMGRIGFCPNDVSINEIKKISKLPNIVLEGIFTHFACADEADKTSVKLQKDRYFDFVDKLEKEGIRPQIKHFCNSASIMEFDNKYLDMVRAGIITYGLYPSDEVDKSKMNLIPAMTLKSHISYVKTVPKGEGISYGLTYVTPSEKIIATVPVGYGDGYPRQLSNKGKVLVNGQFANIVGRVCMDQFMIDVTDIKDVQIGTEVVLVGVQNDKSISVEELANSVGSFNYEFVCNINRRVPRVFIQNGKIVQIVDYLE